MKKFLMCLMLCAGMAHADIIATLRNKAGGLIVLTDVSIDRCKNYAGTAYATGSDSKTTWGCWFSDDLMVHVRWTDGDTTAYPLENFTVNEEVVKRFRERRKGGGQSL
jgi:hypothetical protein